MERQPETGQADHSLLDILVIKEDGSFQRPWLTIVIDDHSRVVSGYYLAFEAPSSLRTSLALRQGIWRKQDPLWPGCGIPEVLYTDNGADFISDHLKQVAADLKMRLVFSLPGKPRGRGRIERFFRTLNEMFLCDLDGYTRRSRADARLTLSGLEEQLRAWLLNTYHRRPGQAAVFHRLNGGRRADSCPASESLEQLDLLLMQELRARKAPVTPCLCVKSFEPATINASNCVRFFWIASRLSTRCSSQARPCSA